MINWLTPSHSHHSLAPARFLAAFCFCISLCVGTLVLIALLVSGLLTVLKAAGAPALGGS